jgi:homoprotocatechuate degradation regulator HpaR
MSKLLPQRNLALLLLAARETVMAYFRPMLNEHGLTEQQWRVIRALLDESPLEALELSQRCQILAPSLTGVLRRMEEMGLVQRERKDTDQRRTLVTLTEQGLAMAKCMAPQVERIYAALTEKLGLDNLSQIYGALEMLIDTLGEGASRTNGARVDFASRRK